MTNRQHQPAVQTAKPKIIIYFIALVAAFAGLLFGLDTGVISGALPSLKVNFQLSNDQQELIVSILLIGAVIGTPLSAIISRIFGRRNAILLSTIIFILSALLSAMAYSITWLVTCRFVLGIAIGIAAFTAPIYISEIAPKDIRGALVTFYQLMITIGIFVAYINDALWCHYMNSCGNWRWMLGAPAVPAIIMFFAVLALPCSPRWLLLKGREQKALAILRRIYSDPEEIKTEISDIHNNLQQGRGAWQLFKKPYFIRVLVLGIVLQCIQQVTGINTIIYYAPTIFKMSGFVSGAEQMSATILIGAINALTTILAVFVIDRIGRRPVMFTGLVIMGCGMLAMGSIFHLFNHGLQDVTALHWAAVAATLIFIFGFAISLGPIMWLLCAEIFPLQGRDIGVTFSNTSNWLFNALVSSTFLTIVNRIGLSDTFYMYAIICLISLLVAYRYAPETKHVSLEQIEINLRQGNPMRRIGE
ncbi:MAG: sugar porter family MFS transporter [Gammaproteobacteria bacterium]|nr:sugar porter family MFS transporter [Gammaproteobacteria bacterium]